MSNTIDRATRGRMGGLTTAARHDTSVYTAPGLARMNTLAKWLEQVPEDVPEEQREASAERLRRLHYIRLGIKSGEARRAKKGK